MSSHYTICEKCDLKIPVGKSALTKGVVCPECGDRFSPKKLNRVDARGRSLTILALINIAVGALLVLASFCGADADLRIFAYLLFSFGLSTFVVAQLLHIRAAVEKLSGK
jgi:uncharacterized paraquat-inducible protein A